MILDIPKEMRRVDSRTFSWFLRSLANPTEQAFANATAWWQDAVMVAVKTTNDQHFIRIKR